MISYQDTHKKVGSEIEVGDVRKTDGGRELRGGEEKLWMKCFLDDFRAFGTSANQWTRGHGA